jgi:hypothetical protein
VAALVVVSALVATAGWHVLLNRRLAERREHQLQAGWLARAGLELAAARLLGDPEGYAGESAEPVARSLVRVTVQREKGSPDTFRVVSEARYPTDARGVVVRELTRRLRRVSEGGRVRLEVLPPEGSASR